MRKRRKGLTAVLCATVLLLGGCSAGGSAWTPQEPDAISVSSDGSVTEIVQETLDKSYYDAAELEEMIHSSVEAYNQKHNGDSVKIVSYKEDDGDVTLKLSYASTEDYAAFNNIEFYQGSIINAQMEGYLFDTSFYRIKDGKQSGDAVDSSAVFNDMSAEVVIVQAPLEVHVDGKVRYISTNAGAISASTVNASGETNEDSYAEQKKANRVYIIYK